MILVSAGHHPNAKGARFRDFNEYDEAVVWCGYICQYLKDAGEVHSYVPTGTLREKVAFINGFHEQASLAIEVHFNSDQARKGKGSETLYYPSSVKGKRAAETMQHHLSNVLWPDRGAKPGYYQMNPANGPDFFLALTSAPALIIEPEFIHNKETIIKNREAGACAIVDGILEIVSHARALDVA